MKKILLLASILLITFLCVGCNAIIGNNEPIETESPEIELTLENYGEYLKIQPTTTEQTTLDWSLYLTQDVGTVKFYTYGIAPGSFKNVNIKLKLVPTQSFYKFVTFSGDAKESIYVSITLPSDGKFTSEEYTMLQTVFSSNAWGPSMSVLVESISGTFVPDKLL